MIISLLLIKLVSLILKAVPDANFEQIEGFLSVTSHVANIFAWARMFLPVDLIIIFLALTALMYTSKFMFKLVNLILNFFK